MEELEKCPICKRESLFYRSGSVGEMEIAVGCSHCGVWLRKQIRTTDMSEPSKRFDSIQDELAVLWNSIKPLT